MTRTESIHAARAAQLQAAAARQEDYYWLRNEQGLTREQAAAQIGVHPRTAQRWDGKRDGITRRDPADAARREQVVRSLNKRGLSDYQIAKQLDITRSGVLIIRRRLGLPAARQEQKATP